MPSILFLDIDGVLNSLRYLKNNPGAFDPIQGPRSIDPEAAGRLNVILERTNAMVVVTSTWRLNHSIEELEYLLRSRGCPSIKIIGLTSCFSSREDGIKEWLSNHPEVKNFAIVDDDLVPFPESQKFVKTTYNDGLLDDHVNSLISLLTT